MLLFLFKRAFIVYQEPMTWSGVACEQALHLNTSGSGEKSRESSTRKESRKSGVIFFQPHSRPSPIFWPRARVGWSSLKVEWCGMESISFRAACTPHTLNNVITLYCAVTSWNSGAPNDRFLSKYIENTFQAIQSTFRYLEMHSKQRAIKFVSVR